MSEARRCEAAGCGKIGEPPFVGWWKIGNESEVVYINEPLEFDACSWECLGALVFEKSELMRSLTEERP